MKLLPRRPTRLFGRLFILLAVVALAGFPSTVQPRSRVHAQASTTEPAQGQPRAQTDVVRATLENGLRVVIVTDPLVPVVTTEMNYLVGANEAPDAFPGMAHAEEHMMFRGSPGLTGDQLSVIGAQLGGDFNAQTQQTVTRYIFTVPAEDLDVVLRVEAMRMQGVLNDEAAWSLERGAIQQEVAQDLSSPSYVLFSRLLATVFKGTPYAHDALGTIPSFERTTAAMLTQFHDTWYAPNNAILVIAGSVDPQKVLGQVRTLFGPVPQRKIPERPEIHLQPVTPETITLPTDHATGMAAVAVQLPGLESPDFAAAATLADVLGSERGRLHDLVVDGKALAAGFDVRFLPKASLGLAYAAFPRGADAKKLVAELERVLGEEVTKGVSADLVEAAKRHETTEAEFRKNSVSGLATAWSEALAVAHRQSPDDDIVAVQKVTKPDVDRVARQYLDLGHAVTAVLEPQSSGTPAAGSARAGGKEKIARPPAKPVLLPDWAERALERLSVPTPTIAPVDRKLANGLRLIVVPETVSDTVSVYGHVKNNPALEAPPGREGVDEVLEELFAYGTTSLDRVSFQRALDDLGADESAGTSFSIRARSRDFDRAVQLLADNELHPALPAAAFKVIRRQVAASVAGRRQSPGYLTRRALNAAVFPKDDPTLREASPESVSSLTLDDVRGYVQRVFRPDLTTIVVIGNVPAATVEATITKHFGAWAATGPAPATVLPSVPTSRPSITTVPNSSRQQDRVVLGETLGITRSSADYYPLALANTVLGGGLSGRLYRTLREMTGLVYDVSSSVEAGERRAVLLLEYGCDPSNVARVRSMVESELADMRSTPITADELRRAKSMLLRHIPLSEQSVHSIAAGLLYRSTVSLPLDEPTTAANRYLALTAEDVMRAFSASVRPADLAEVTEGPVSR